MDTNKPTFMQVLAIFKIEGGSSVDMELYFNSKDDLDYFCREDILKQLKPENDYEIKHLIVANGVVEVWKMPTDVIKEKPKYTTKAESLPDEETLPQYRKKKEPGRKTGEIRKLNFK